MKLKLACVALGAMLAAAGSAQAGGDIIYRSSVKDRVAVPAPIPVPGPMPVAEGFSYYLRADLGWGFSGDRSYAETGRTYGNGAAPFISSTGAFTSSGLTGFGNVTSEGVFLGTVGAGVYLSPRLRGDITLDFRSKQDFDSDTTYSYTSTTAGTTVNGVVRDRLNLNTTAALANLYFDLLPRGAFSPYIGAGIGLVYNDASRTYTETATPIAGGVAGTTLTVTGSSKETNVALAGALMAGVTISRDHKWAIDIGYRALYMDGVDVSSSLNTTPTATSSKGTLGDQWEHQVRIGLRFNIW